MQPVANAATVAQECIAHLTAGLEPAASALRDADGTSAVFLKGHIERVRITDFVPVVSTEYTIDFVLSLDVSVMLFYDTGFAPPVHRVLR
eukprot:2794972-Rhodomonas_salina.1